MTFAVEISGGASRRILRESAGLSEAISRIPSRKM